MKAEMLEAQTQLQRLRRKTGQRLGWKLSHLLGWGRMMGVMELYGGGGVVRDSSILIKTQDGILLSPKNNFCHLKQHR